MTDITAGKELRVPRARSLEDQKLKRKGYGMELGAMALCGLIIYLGFQSPKILNYVKEAVEGNRFKRAYESALVRYADTNNDKFISDEENKEFYNSILFQNNAQRNPKGFPIKDGKEISVEEFRRWVENYHPYNRFEE